MIRILIPLLLFLLPFALYGMYILLMRANARRKGQTDPVAISVNYLALGGVGLFLGLVGVGIVGTLVSKEHAIRYEPPRLTPEGRVIPGEFITDEDSSE